MNFLVVAYCIRSFGRARGVALVAIVEQVLLTLILKMHFQIFVGDELFIAVCAFEVPLTEMASHMSPHVVYAVKLGFFKAMRAKYAIPQSLSQFVHRLRAVLEDFILLEHAF